LTILAAGCTNLTLKQYVHLYFEPHMHINCISGIDTLARRPFVTLTPPTKPMLTEAASAGFYVSPHHGNFPKIQILTVEGLLSGAEAPKYVDLSQGELSFKKAKQEKQTGEQQPLF